MLNAINTPTGRYRNEVILKALEVALNSYQYDGDTIKAEEVELLINEMKEAK